MLHEQMALVKARRVEVRPRVAMRSVCVLAPPPNMPSKATPDLSLVFLGLLSILNYLYIFAPLFAVVKADCLETQEEALWLVVLLLW